VNQEIHYPATKQPEETKMYSWLVKFTPSDQAHLRVESKCSAENFNVKFEHVARHR